MVTRLAAFASAIALLAGLGGNAKADVYSYAQQTLTNFTFTGATINLPSLTTTSGDNAVQNVPPTGSVGFVDDADSLQAFVGAAGDNPGENSFVQRGPTATNYIRSDELITPGFTASVVAEGNLHNIGQSASQAQWAISAPITVAVGSTGIVTLTFNYANLLQVITTGSLANESGTARFSFNFTIETLTSPAVVLFESSPILVNSAISRNTTGSTTNPDAGTVVITNTTPLAPGTYQATITGTLA